MKNMLLHAALPAAMLGLAVVSGAADLRTENVEYRDGGVLLEGYLAYDASIKTKRPGVLIIHEWTGIGPYVKNRAEQLARLGYVAFAADIYGKGIRPANTDEAARQAGIYRADRQLMRSRAAAAFIELKKMPLVDAGRTAVVGYCFGGGVALELARSGAELSGVASFHGNLDTPSPGDAKNIKAKVIAFHGADDPYVTPAIVSAFQDEMRGGGVDWQMVIYGGAVHSFSNPASGNDTNAGVAYNEKADKRSWQALQDFFGEIFAPAAP